MELQLRLAMLSPGIKDVYRYPRFLVCWPVGHLFVDVVLRSPSTVEGEWLFEADEVFMLSTFLGGISGDIRNVWTVPTLVWSVSIDVCGTD